MAGYAPDGAPELAESAEDPELAKAYELGRL
jgi:hypothetical protein